MIPHFRWADGQGITLEQWNWVQQRWMPSERAVYLDCLRRREVVVMNPAHDPVFIG